jgi:hypothetical protein
MTENLRYSEPMLLISAVELYYFVIFSLWLWPVLCDEACVICSCQYWKYIMAAVEKSCYGERKWRKSRVCCYQTILFAVPFGAGEFLLLPFVWVLLEARSWDDEEEASLLPACRPSRTGLIDVANDYWYAITGVLFLGAIRNIWLALARKVTYPTMAGKYVNMIRWQY